MNKTLIFLCFSTAILVFSIIVVCVSPIINNFENQELRWKISSWRTLNCQIFADKENADNVQLDEIQRFKKLKKICYRKKAMHDLEYAALIINLIFGFVCANFSLLHYLGVGKDFEKKTGLIGLIFGIIGFIIILVYVCYNGYIFDNDIAYGEYNGSRYLGKVDKLYSNGATRKKDETNSFIYVYNNDNTDFSEFAKFKDLGKKQYNYNSKFYKTYVSSTDCKSYNLQCEYIYETSPTTSVENKELYDRWLTTLILSIFILISNIGLLIFGFLLFKSKDDSNETKPVEIE